MLKVVFHLFRLLTYPNKNEYYFAVIAPNIAHSDLIPKLVIHVTFVNLFKIKMHLRSFTAAHHLRFFVWRYGNRIAIIVSLIHNNYWRKVGIQMLVFPKCLLRVASLPPVLVIHKHLERIHKTYTS